MPRPRLLLTGAAGFVGAQVRAHLDAELETVCVSRSSRSASAGEWVAADLRDATTCRRLISDVRPTHLIHTAWNTEHGKFWEAEDNEAWLDAGKALFAAFAEAGGRRIVACGSCAEYGGDMDAPLSEDEAGPRPASLYGRSKLALCEYLAALPVSSSWARIFNAYGPAEDPGRLVPSTILKLLRGEPAACSSGRQIRDFIDVRDLGAALALLAKAALTGPINLGNGSEHTVGEVARRIADIVGRPDLLMLGALPDRVGEPARLVPDLRRQRQELAFSPRISLDEGLSDAVTWWSRASSLNHHG